MDHGGVAATERSGWQRVRGFDLSWRADSGAWTVTVHRYDGTEDVLVEEFPSVEDANLAAVEFIEGWRP